MIPVTDKFYELYSNPLRIVEDSALIEGYSYCTENGNIVRIVDIDYDTSLTYDILHKSELVEGELVTGLTEKLLKMFWALTRNNFGRMLTYENDTD